METLIFNLKISIPTDLQYYILLTIYVSFLWSLPMILYNINKVDMPSVVHFIGVRVMVFNTTFNDISVVSMEKIEYPEKTTAASHWHTLSHNVVSSTPCH